MRFLALLAALMIFTPPAFAQQKEATIPEIPEALQLLSERGAQMRYLGNEHGMEGWIAIYQGQEQYYYITQDKKAFVTGLMFGSDGKPITIEQVSALQAQGGDVLDLLAVDKPKEENEVKIGESVTDKMELKTPAERMFADVQNSNWVKLGSESAPVIYSFVDPNCPHCHDFLDDLRKKDLISKGVVQVRIIPVGFQDGSLAQASFLLAAPDAEERYMKYLDGDKEALPAKQDISTQAVQKNMALMNAWKFNVTPLTIYRDKKGEVKIIRGRAKDTDGLISDLQTAASADATPVPTAR